MQFYSRFLPFNFKKCNFLFIWKLSRRISDIQNGVEKNITNTREPNTESKKQTQTKVVGDTWVPLLTSPPTRGTIVLI